MIDDTFVCGRFFTHAFKIEWYLAVFLANFHFNLEIAMLFYSLNSLL